MDADSAAPVVAKTQLLIAADQQLIWNVLTDFERWPEWKKDVRAMSLHGPVAPGSTFVWKAGPGTIKSKLREVAAPSKIAWTGSTLGIKAIDTISFESHSDGTLVTQEESWNGLLPRLFRRRMQATLQSGIERGLRALKAEAERQAKDQPQKSPQ